MTESQAQYATYPSLKGCRVLISGGASGIGEAFVAAFAAQGAAVAFLDIQDQLAAELVARIAAAGHPVPIYLRCDMTDIKAVRAATAQAIESLNGLDVLINNAGNDRRHAIEEVTPELWDQLMAVNLRHQFFITQAAIPALKQSGNASILNMSSIAWLIPSVGLPVYVTAKAAIVGMTHTLAHELGKDNIRVNAILPGAIVTDKQRKLVLTAEYSAEILASQAIKRHLVPDEVARLALFLASEDSSAITGQSHIIDGGWI
ncbi:SDR family NAD(P)-dependent oxidoreductase [Acidicapsa ligni]|uniref:SDR family NAD(P)-dependent oxidoreductase n=1 Tax=Acidicapsa ligni TaxID=542300 RepID=UPI0021E0EC95|nr:SDR family NAD(P)-dependent oxidoreductase [Acidicapsa ligni]